MSEARMERMEDMMHQLIGMVGTVISSQNVMKEDIVVIKEDIIVMKTDISEMKTDITRLNERVDRVCYQHDTSFQYLNAKVSQHDHDIYVLQKNQYNSTSLTHSSFVESAFFYPISRFKKL